MTDLPLVCVLILNWNGERDTVEAVRSAERLDYPNAAVIVIDNGSRPESLRHIRQACPGVECLETADNLGYAGGNNAGLRLAIERGAAYCLILNNDLTVDPPMLRLLVDAAEAHPDLAVLGPRVFRHDKPDVLFYPPWKIDWHRRLFYRSSSPAPPPPSDFPLPLRERGRGEGPSSSAPAPPAAHAAPDAASPAALFPVDYVQGCAMLVRTSFLRAHGCFDERFHLYCEDADLCVRARRAGFRVAELAAARVWHKGYRSSGRRSPLKTYYGLRNRLLFIAKHAPRANRLRLRAHLLRDAASQALDATSGILGGNARAGAATLRALARALFDALRGAYGKGPDWLFSKKTNEE